MTFAARFVCVALLGLLLNFPFSDSNPLGDFQRDHFTETFSESEQAYLQTIRCRRGSRGEKCLKWWGKCVNCDCYHHDRMGEDNEDGRVLFNSCEKTCDDIDPSIEGVCGRHEGDGVFYDLFAPLERTYVYNTPCPRNSSDGRACLELWHDCFRCPCYQPDRMGEEDADGRALLEGCKPTGNCVVDRQWWNRYSECVRFEGDPEETFLMRFSRYSRPIILGSRQCPAKKRYQYCKSWDNGCYECDCNVDSNGNGDRHVKPETCRRIMGCSYEEFIQKGGCNHWLVHTWSVV